MQIKLGLELRCNGWELLEGNTTPCLMCWRNSDRTAPIGSRWTAGDAVEIEPHEKRAPDSQGKASVAVGPKKSRRSPPSEWGWGTHVIAQPPHADMSLSSPSPISTSRPVLLVKLSSTVYFTPRSQGSAVPGRPPLASTTALYLGRLEDRRHLYRPEEVSRDIVWNTRSARTS
jgi:hypothetical protein